MNRKHDTERSAQGFGTGLGGHGRPNKQPKYISANKRHGGHSLISVVAAIVLAVGGGRQVQAGGNDWVWTGAASSDQWSAGFQGGTTNWDPNILPSSSRDIAFLNFTPFMSVDLQTHRTINSITFGGTNPYTLHHGELALGGGDITVSGSANHVIDAPITLLGDGFLNITGGSLLLLQDITSETLSAYGITKVGDGMLNINSVTGDIDRLYSDGGPTNIDGTELNLRSSADAIYVAGDGRVNIRSGSVVTCHPQTLLYVQSNSLDETPTLTISNSILKPVGTVYLSYFDNTTGHLVVEDNGVIESILDLEIGKVVSSEASTVIVRTGGKVNTVHTQVGVVPGSEGIADVSGETSRWDTVYLLLGGQGHFTVRDGAALTAIEAGVYSNISTLTVSDATFAVQRLSTVLGATPTIRLTNPANGYALTITNDDPSLTGNFGGVVMDSPAGPGSLLKTGSGAQSLSNQNQYTGGTRIEEGALNLLTFNALPPDGDVVLLPAGTLILNGNVTHIDHFEMLGGLIMGTPEGSLRPQNMWIESGQIFAPILTNMITKDTGGSVTFNAPVSANGLVAAAGAVLNNDTLNLQSSGSIIESGELINEGTVFGLVNVLHGGEFLGSGSASEVFVADGGILSPGDEVGQMSISIVQFGDDAIFRVHLASENGTAGTDHDHLAVGVGATLSGTLEVRFIDEFVPAPGASFVVLTTAPDFAGSFDAVTFPEGTTGHLAYDYGVGTVTVVIGSGVEDLPGDMNCDSAVNLDDVAPFVSTILDLGSSGDCNPMRADMNQDDLLNGADLQGFVDVLMMP